MSKMNTLLINEEVENTIKQVSKKIYIGRLIYIFSLTYIVLLFIEILVLGFNIFEFLMIFSLILFFLGLMIKYVFKPNYILKNLIRKISFEDNRFIFHNELTSFTPERIEKKFGFNLYNTNANIYYILYFDSKKYYLVPDFYDEFNSCIKEHFRINFNT